jgi:hypothetical protein
MFKLIYGDNMKKSLVKRFALMIMLVISFSFILTGCNLFERNWFKYYNAVVVSIEYPDGETIEINKRELITAFNNYGANLVNNYGQSYEQAMETTINQLVNQKVLLKKSKEETVITNAEKNKLYTDTLKSVNEYFEPLLEEVEKDWEIDGVEIIEAEEESKESLLYTPYEKKVELIRDDKGNLKLQLLNLEKDPKAEELKYEFMSDVYDTDTIVDVFYNFVINKTQFKSENPVLNESELLQQQNARVYKEAVRRLISNIKVNEKGLKLSTDDESVLKRTLKVFYENSLDNLLINNIQEVITPTAKFSQITIANLLTKYKNLAGTSYEKYFANPSVLESDMLDSYSNVNYYGNFSLHKAEEKQDFFFVSHILIQLTDQDKAELEELDKKRDIGGTGEIGEIEYHEKVNQILNRVKAQERDDEGNIIEVENSSQQKYAADVLRELKLALAQTQTNEQKATAFRNVMYKYNQDPGSLNSEYLYVIGSKESRMVESFTDASRKLYDNGNGEFGQISELVRSTHGLHIVFYAGDVKDYMPFEISSLNSFNVENDEENAFVLDSVLLNPLSNKTLLDKVFESVADEVASKNESMYLNVVKADLTIKKYTSNYKDLLK